MTNHHTILPIDMHAYLHALQNLQSTICGRTPSPAVNLALAAPRVRIAGHQVAVQENVRFYVLCEGERIEADPLTVSLVRNNERVVLDTSVGRDREVIRS